MQRHVETKLCNYKKQRRIASSEVIVLQAPQVSTESNFYSTFLTWKIFENAKFCIYLFWLENFLQRQIFCADFPT